MEEGSLFAQLRPRNVYKGAVAYAVISWLLIQAASILLPTFEAPSWVMKVFVVLLALGFILAVFVSWAFEATPEGLKRTGDVSRDAAARLPTWSARKFAGFITVIALAAVALLALEIVRHKPMPESATASERAAPQKSIAVLPLLNESGEP